MVIINFLMLLSNCSIPPSMGYILGKKFYVFVFITEERNFELLFSLEMIIQLVFAKVFHVASWVIIGGWIGVKGCTLCMCVYACVCISMCMCKRAFSL